MQIEGIVVMGGNENNVHRHLCSRLEANMQTCCLLSHWAVSELAFVTYKKDKYILIFYLKEK
jgi:hypothetical protein